jgi:hypothetical protein
MDMCGIHLRLSIRSRVGQVGLLAGDDFVNGYRIRHLRCEQMLGHQRDALLNLPPLIPRNTLDR